MRLVGLDVGIMAGLRETQFRQACSLLGREFGPFQSTCIYHVPDFLVIGKVLQLVNAGDPEAPNLSL